ncbi:MAG: MMPL family transporter [Acidimicrobiia bacterium]
MLAALARFTIARRRLVLVLATLTFVVAGGVGGGVAQELSSGGFEDPSSESARADDVLLDTFGAGVPNVVLLVEATDGTVDDLAAAGTALTEELAAEADVAEAVSYWTLGGAPPLRSEDGTQALVLARIEGDEDHISERIEDISPAFTREEAGFTVAVGGFAEVFRQVGHSIEEDLLRAEMIAIPITLLLLLFVFRGVVAALLPLAIGGLSVVSTFLVLRIINSFTDVSVFALNLTTAMGLGLAIDYSLFVVSRYREELAGGYEPGVALVRTVRTAGRTVAFSAGTVAVSLLALLVFPFAFLRSFAYAGVAVAVLAGLFSVLVLPAMLAALGPRIDAWSLRPARTKADEDGFWHRMAVVTMRRPIPITTAVVAVLFVLGAPFLRFAAGVPDDRVLPESFSSRQVSDAIRDGFSSQEAGAASVVATGIGDVEARLPEIADYATRLSLLDGVARVDSAAGIAVDGQVLPGELTPPGFAGRFSAAGATYLSVVPDETVEPISPEGEDLARAIRGTDAPFEVAVTGQSAQLVDSTESLMDKLPIALAMIGGITVVLLFLMFGSVVIPIKALVLNVLSLSATFGAMVWIFQDGNLSEVLGFTATGTIAVTTPILMFCIAFGLSMDYEVFLLSRIKEEYDRTGDNERSVALGLERTGRIVTAAALLIAVVFIAMASARVSFIKLFGIGLALAVLMDAFLIRATLVPAFMRLAGGANWWAPRWLRRVHERVGIREHVDLTDDDEPGRATAAAGDDELVPALAGVGSGGSSGHDGRS